MKISYYLIYITNGKRYILSLIAFREESEQRPLREHQRLLLRDTTESNIVSFIQPLYRLTNDFHTNKRIIDDIAII